MRLLTTTLSENHSDATENVVWKVRTAALEGVSMAFVVSSVPFQPTPVCVKKPKALLANESFRNPLKKRGWESGGEYRTVCWSGGSSMDGGTL